MIRPGAKVLGSRIPLLCGWGLPRRGLLTELEIEMAETCVICGREKRDVYEGGSVGGPWCFEEMGESCCRLGYERAQAKLEQAERALAQARDGAFANIAEAEVIKLAN